MESRVLFLIFTNNAPHFASAGITHASLLKLQIVIDLHLILKLMETVRDLTLETVSGVKVGLVKWSTHVIPRNLGVVSFTKVIRSQVFT